MYDIRFSLIVVLYKSSHHLQRLLDNVDSVLPGVDDIILVDNSAENLSRFESNKIRIIYPETNLGYGSAMNRGVAAAKNDSLVLINPDIDIENFNFSSDLISDELFIVSGRTHLMESLPVFPRLGWDLIRIGFCNIGYPFGYLRRFFPRRPLKFNKGFAPADWIPGCLLITNKKTMDKLGGFDENYFLFYEEVDLCRRAVEAEVRVGIVDTIGYVNFHGTSSNIDVSEIKMKAEMESLVRYHRRFNPGLWSIFCIIFLKLWCGFVGGILSIGLLCIKNQKLRNKVKQYLNYYRSLNFNTLAGE